MAFKNLCEVGCVYRSRVPSGYICVTSPLVTSSYEQRPNPDHLHPAERSLMVSGVIIHIQHASSSSSLIVSSAGHNILHLSPSDISVCHLVVAKVLILSLYVAFSYRAAHPEKQHMFCADNKIQNDDSDCSSLVNLFIFRSANL